MMSTAISGAVGTVTHPEMGKVLRSMACRSLIFSTGHPAGRKRNTGSFLLMKTDGRHCKFFPLELSQLISRKLTQNSEYDNFGDASRAAVEAMIADISGKMMHNYLII